ncbi:uncharacterized protein TM35_000141310 [Trypanosoma theileri]|uniref:DUF4456 domain-containing protein n=1 Tax=Trypanosoma theileri TaxID=67003 RepID=A0A1X0NXQ7_9TRYP|nr:uncharacterized protein TM35_000141310 [Trypanosoma theileri]ORC88920.1 hypothetical protein TM35_000141310 [Trypanosoma theileri]
MSLQRPAVKESRLRARLGTRFQQVLMAFQDGVLEFNKVLDEQQVHQLADLKEFLQYSHNEIAGGLLLEEQRVESHKSYLEKYSKTLADAANDEVLPPFTDPYHSAEMRPDEGIGRLKTERQRLLSLSVAVKSSYDARLGAISECERALAERERERRDGMRESLVKLVASLAPIGYVSITGTQVIAQRVIHATNRRLCESHACAATLLSRLRCREVLRYRTYTRRLAEVYGASLRLMAMGRRLWAATLLRTATLRRPAARDRVVRETRALAAAGRRAGGEFLRATGAAAESLRRHREPTAEESGGPPPPGGTRADGWLRAFDGRLNAPVFSASPVDVAIEWRVKANVLVRNTVARAAAHIEAVKEGEQRLCNEAESVYTALLAVLRWVCTPEAEETVAWTNASLQGVDPVYAPFTVPNDTLLANLTAEADQQLPPLLASIRRESEWFTDVVEVELQTHHTALEELLLTGPVNVLTTFQRATEALEVTTTSAIGFIRSRLLAISDARKDHEDTLQRVESELAQCQARLRHAITKEAAEVLFVKGLKVLERIAAEHTQFHRCTVQMLQQIMQEGPEEVERHCVALLRLLGLESEESCEQRLEQERRDREAAAAAAAAASAKRGRAKEVVVELHSESDEEDATPSYPTITAADGEVFCIVAPMALDDRQRVTPIETPPPLPLSETTSGQGMKGRTLTPVNKRKATPTTPPPPQQQQEGRRNKNTTAKRQSNSESTHSTPEPIVEPLPAFLRTYETLLKSIVSEDDGTELISVDAVERWREMLRYEILNWAIDLSRTSRTFVQEECTSQKSLIDKETNEVLRHHRRRPAALQAETYEVRLRDIENTRTTEEKYTKRLRDRALQLEVVLSSIGENNDMDEHDAKFFEQLQELENKAKTANSVNLLHAQEREFANLVASSVEDHTRRQNKLLAELAREQESLESECRSYLLDCGMVIPTNLDEVQDCSSFGSEGTVSREAMETLIRLHNVTKAVKERLAVQYEQHMRCIDAARVSYSNVYEQNVGELQMLARLQEVLTRLKVQVHSLIALSDASEAKIEKILKDFEEKINTPTPLHNFTNTLCEITSRDYGAAAADSQLASNIGSTTIGGKEVGGIASLTLEHTRTAEEELGARLAEVKLDIQRQIQSSDVAKVLRILDSLREELYTRGRHLNCLQYGVEFFNVPQENYIEPRLGTVPDLTSMETSGTIAASLPQQNRVSRKARAQTQINSAMASLYTIGELPEVIPAELEVGQWLTAVKSQIETIVGQHFTECPSSLTRRLSGMTGGQFEDVIEKTNSVCGQQKQRVLHHIEQATRRYRQQVQRVFEGIQKLPVYLSSSIYSMSATALERRVETVFSGFASFYGESEMMRGVYDRLVKVTLGSNYNRDKLEALRSAEGTRQEVTEMAIEKFWGYALREMEDEATMHAARALNVNNNFFAFLQGLVTPDKLKPPADNDVTGQHRGLRRLLRLKEREERTREMQQQQSQRPPSPKRERRLQETMPRQKHGGMQADKNAVVSRKSDSTIDINSGPLPLPSTREVEYVRVPLRAFRPLEEFNATHPNATVEALNQDVAPTFTRVSLTPHSQSVTGGGGGGRRQKSECVSSPPKEDVVSIVAPASLLHKETAALTQQSVELFNKTSADAAIRTNDSFQQWSTREVTWREIWNAAIDRLKT